MPRERKEDDPEWENLSPRQKAMIRRAVHRALTQPHDIHDLDFLDKPTPPEEQLKSLQGYYEGRGPHINFEDSIVSKVASEVFAKAARRKLN